jgi:hypothetical protein
MKPGLKRCALGLLLLPLLGAATGCSSQDSSPDAAAPASVPPSAVKPGATPSSSAGTAPGSPAASEPAAASQEPGPGTAPGADPGANSGPSSGADPGAVVQSPQPAPEPTFDAPQEQFLADKVPEGTDPNAVLQVGQERCDQLISAKAMDPESVISELIMNPASDTVDAIGLLCPEMQPELDAAGRGFPDGTFSVGQAAPHSEKPSIAPGTYRAYGAPEGCTISVYGGNGNLIGTYDGSSPVEITAGSARVESDQCYSWFRS